MQRRTTSIAICAAATVATCGAIAFEGAVVENSRPANTTETTVRTENQIFLAKGLGTTGLAETLFDPGNVVVLDGQRTFQGATSNLRWEFHPDGGLKVVMNNKPHYIRSGNISYTYIELSDEVQGWEITPDDTVTPPVTLQTVLGLDPVGLAAHRTVVTEHLNGYTITQTDKITGKNTATINLNTDRTGNLLSIEQTTPDDHTMYKVETVRDTTPVKAPQSAVERGVLQRRYDQTPLGKAANNIVTVVDATVADLMAGPISAFDQKRLETVLANSNLDFDVQTHSDSLGVIGFSNTGTSINLAISDGVGHCRYAIVEADGTMVDEDTNGTPTNTSYTCTPKTAGTP